MKKVKITFNISADVVGLLESRVPKRKRNTFIEEAIHARFSIMEQEKFMQELIMENKTRAEGLELVDASLELDDAILQSDDFMNEDEMFELDEIL